MSDLNYDEVTNSVYPSTDPMFHWDSHFPERFSRMHITSPEIGLLSPAFNRKNRRPKDKNRYKTQPITFDEIKEVDEDIGLTTSASEAQVKALQQSDPQKAKTPSLNAQHRSFDLPTNQSQGSLLGSDKENTPHASLLSLAQNENESDTARRELPGFSRRKRSIRNLRSRNRNSVQEVPEGEDNAGM